MLKSRLKCHVEGHLPTDGKLDDATEEHLISVAAAIGVSHISVFNKVSPLLTWDCQQSFARQFAEVKPASSNSMSHLLSAGCWRGRQDSHSFQVPDETVGAIKFETGAG
jgi:hypothetical protein